MLTRLTALLAACLCLSGPVQAEEAVRNLRGLTLGMSREAALETLSHFRFFCEPAIQHGYRRHHGTLCRYREYHFGIFFTVRPDDGTVYRIEVEDKYPNGFDLEAVDARLRERFGKPDVSKRNAMFSGSYLRVWEPDLTVRLEDYEKDTIRLVLEDPAVDEDLQRQWYAELPSE